MIEPVEQAIQRTYGYYLVLFAVLIGMSALCFVKTKRKANMMIYGIAVAVLTIIILITSFVPFAIDCCNSDILETECIYINSVGDKAKTPSSIMGIYSVKLLIDSQPVNVSTVPLSKSCFPVGEYTVKAYYTRSSKRLLYIEILN